VTIYDREDKVRAVVRHGYPSSKQKPLSDLNTTQKKAFYTIHPSHLPPFTKKGKKMKKKTP